MEIFAIDAVLQEALLAGVERIGFFVFARRFYWVIDWEAHFNLDQKRNFDAHLRHKYFPMSQAEYAQALRTFRGGIVNLTAERFMDYLQGTDTKIMSVDALRTAFFSDDRGQYRMLLRQLEDAQSFDATIDEDLQELGWRLLSLLPGFYVNFERRIFLHRVAGRVYESVVPDGWQGAQGDFVHLIPVSQRYWVRNADEDFWMIPWLFD